MSNRLSWFVIAWLILVFAFLYAPIISVRSAARRRAKLIDRSLPDLIDLLVVTVALIIAEPVQNAAGCLVPPEGYWKQVREICDRHAFGERHGPRHRQVSPARRTRWWSASTSRSRAWP